MNKSKKTILAVVISGLVIAGSATTFAVTHNTDSVKAETNIVEPKELSAGKTEDTLITNVSLKATFDGKTYKINYDLDGGTNGNNPATYKYGEGVKSFENASKDGYIFDGWFSDAAKTKQVTSLAGDSHNDVTLYAKFHEKPAPTPVARNNGGYGNSGSNYSGNSYSGGSGSNGSMTYGGTTHRAAQATESNVQSVIDSGAVAFMTRDYQICDDTGHILATKYMDWAFCHDGLGGTQIANSSVVTLNGRTYHKIRSSYTNGKTYWGTDGFPYDNCQKVAEIGGTLIFQTCGPNNNYLMAIFG